MRLCCCACVSGSCLLRTGARGRVYDSSHYRVLPFHRSAGMVRLCDHYGRACRGRVPDPWRRPAIRRFAACTRNPGHNCHGPRQKWVVVQQQGRRLGIPRILGGCVDCAVSSWRRPLDVSSFPASVHFLISACKNYARLAHRELGRFRTEADIGPDL